MEAVNHEYYVSPEVAKLLKEAGFDWEVNHSYPDCESLDNSCSGYMEDLPFYHNLNDGKYGGMSAPTLDVAQRWLREVKGYDIEIHVCHHYGISAKKGYFHELVINNEDYEDDDISSQFSRTYEETQEAGIKKALELILEKGE